jgi:tetratricopeptide (TPR) repeat protein
MSGMARPVRSPEPGSTRAAPEGEARLSASGEVVSEYSGSREAGWRDASSESIDESIRQLLESGRKGAAARIAWDAGRHEQALGWFRELGLHYQAGACLRALGRMQEALEALLQVPIDGPHYRKAAFELVPVANALSRIDFDIDRFFTKLIDEGPREPEEIATFLELAQLYRRADFLRGAVRCVGKVLALDPKHAAALALRSELEGRATPSARPQPMPVAQRGLPELPTLEEFTALARAHVPPRT